MFGRRRPGPHAALEKSIGYTFRNRKLLEVALVHRSYRFENSGIDYDNQRLEFLGDAALGLMSAASLYESMPGGDEGTLTHQRSRITSGRALARIAQRLELGAQLMLGKGEEQSGGRQRESNLADGLEAVLGAVYLDGGMKAVDKVFRTLFLPEISAGAGRWEENPKGELQELCQRLWQCSPQYRFVSEKGPSHDRMFTVDVVIRGSVAGRGRGTSKRNAEMQAAAAALQRTAARQG